MKRLSLLCLLILSCSLPAYSQFWISFGWNEPHCKNCLWMERSLRLPPWQAGEYHKIIHKYGQRIEKEARRDYRYWDRAARKIYNLRMERDRKIQFILTPPQFNQYIRFARERPQRIHDYRGWYNNPRYPHYRPSYNCNHYEVNYWNHRWNNSHYHNPWKDKRYNGRNDRDHSPNYKQSDRTYRKTERSESSARDKKERKEKEKKRNNGRRTN